MTRASKLFETTTTTDEKKVRPIIEASFSMKDVSNELLSKKTGGLGISVLNAMENNINVFTRWILFSSKQTPDLETVKEYKRAFEEHVQNINKFMKELEKDYKDL